MSGGDRTDGESERHRGSEEGSERAAPARRAKQRRLGRGFGSGGQYDMVGVGTHKGGLPLGGGHYLRSHPRRRRETRRQASLRVRPKALRELDVLDVHLILIHRVAHQFP